MPRQYRIQGLTEVFSIERLVILGTTIVELPTVDELSLSIEQEKSGVHGRAIGLGRGLLGIKEVRELVSLELGFFQHERRGIVGVGFGIIRANPTIATPRLA